MNEIHRPDLYQQNQAPQAPRAKRRSTALIPAIIALFFVAGLSFGLGFRANEEGWFEQAAANESNALLPDDLSYESVEDVYDALRKNYDGQLTEEELLDGIKRGLAKASGDNYTVYFNESETQQFYSDLNGSFEGIGAELSNEGDLVVVVAPIKGFPAEEAGLRPQDAIIEIDGEDAIGIPVEEAVTKIRGEAGTDVTLTIARDGERLEITITRATITIPSVEFEYLEDGRIGYLQVTRFAEDTSALARAAAQEFKDNNVEGVILDMRSNSGGFVDAAIDISSIWLTDEVVFEQRSGGQSDGSSVARGNPILNGVPTVVLINEGSASASEIVAGALKDHSAAQLVGKTSFGKGSVQSLREFDDGSTLKVTVARWFTPAGVNIDEDGIVPDIEVEFTEEDFENDTDSQRDRAIEILNQN
jgi:carboxyl-terminal processing protease